MKPNLKVFLFCCLAGAVTGAILGLVLKDDEILGWLFGGLITVIGLKLFGK